MRIIKAAACAIVISSLCGTALAGPVYVYSGICLTQCPTIGLSTGESVGGWIKAIDGADAPEPDGSLKIQGIELVEWALDFGTRHFDEFNSTVSGFIQDIEPDGMFDVGSLRFLMAGPDDDLFTLEFNDSWRVQVADVADARGSGSYTAVPVPEPGTLSLLAIGLASMIWVKRRKNV